MIFGLSFEKSLNKTDFIKIMVMLIMLIMMIMMMMMKTKKKKKMIRKVKKMKCLRRFFMLALNKLPNKGVLNL